MLEIAPGPARVTVDVADALPAPPVLMDASAQMLAEARNRMRANHRRDPRLVQGDAFRLPFASGFDLVYSFRLIRHFGDLFQVEAEWRWSGEHYARTARAWLANYDANAVEIAVILRKAYGPDALLWGRRWRLFFLATEGLFGHAGGAEWGVSHSRLAGA